jgi:hypothetical protein
VSVVRVIDMDYTQPSARSASRACLSPALLPRVCTARLCAVCWRVGFMATAEYVNEGVQFTAEPASRHPSNLEMLDLADYGPAEKQERKVRVDRGLTSANHTRARTGGCPSRLGQRRFEETGCHGHSRASQRTRDFLPGQSRGLCRSGSSSSHTLVGVCWCCARQFPH